MKRNSIYVKYSYIEGVLTVDEYFIVEGFWGALMLYLDDPYDGYGAPLVPYRIEDFFDLLTEDFTPLLYPSQYKIPAGKEILDHKWGGSFSLEQDMYLQEWSGIQFKLEIASENRYSFASRRLVYASDHWYNKAYGENWGDSESKIQRVSEDALIKFNVTSGQPGGLIYQKTTYTGNQGDCETGDTQIVIDIPMSFFHEECGESEGIDWEDYILNSDVYEFPCSTTIKNPGPYSCNASLYGVSWSGFSGSNSYSSWVGAEVASSYLGKEINGICYQSPFVPGGVNPVVHTPQLSMFSPHSDVALEQSFGLRIE